MKSLIISVFALAVTGCASNAVLPPMRVVPTAPATAGGIDWQVLNRFRLIDGEQEEQRFYKHLSAYVGDFEEWYAREGGFGANVLKKDLLHPEQDDNGNPRNFRTRYNPQTGSYRCASGDGNPTCRDGRSTDWIADSERLVRLSARGLTGDCMWRVGVRAFRASCREATAEVEVDQAVPVAATAVSGGRQATGTIHARAMTVVALGDSFSAGEGVPHAQWRTRGNNRPAVWLDARCHRSLISAPSLTAAYLARHNPHLSVTLLHYGCSGASIADGVLTPWAHLEHYDRIEKRWRRFRGSEGIASAPWDQRPAPFSKLDVPRSQIEQAAADLDLAHGGRRPDLVLLSTGGNDVGFGGLVTSLLFPIWTPTDLSDGKKEDRRPVASFDQARWADVAAKDPCGGVKGLPCLEKHMALRLAGPGESLTTQFDALAPALTALTNNEPARVFISKYPSFLRRPATADERAATGQDTAFCVDRPFDRRAGMVPGITAWFAGLKEGAAERAETNLLTPLNTAVGAAADKYKWTLVDAHVSNGLANGYCSPRRQYNTLIDAYWNQGRNYVRGAPRPLGNLVVRNPVPGVPLAKNEKAVWDAERLCFTQSAADPCLEVDLQYAVEFKRDMKALEGDDPTRGHDRGSWIADLLTSGPVHPNLFGHCNYAASMVSAVAKSETHQPLLDAGFIESIPTAGLKAEDICNAGKWGYVPAAEEGATARR